MTRLTYVVQMAPLKAITKNFQASVLARVSRLMVRRFVRLQCQLADGAPAAPPPAEGSFGAVGVQMSSNA